MNPQFTPPENAAGVANKSPWLVHAGAVAGAAGQEDASLTLKFEIVVIQGSKVYVAFLTNPEHLYAGVELTWFKKELASTVATAEAAAPHIYTGDTATRTRIGRKQPLGRFAVVAAVGDRKKRR